MRPYLRGKIYITNDSLVSRDGYRKPNRRVVAVNNDENNMRIVKIKSLYDSSGRRRRHLIPIEQYDCLTKASGIHPKVYSKTARNCSIRERALRRTECRLTDNDMRKISRLW